MEARSLDEKDESTFQSVIDQVLQDFEREIGDYARNKGGSVGRYRLEKGKTITTALALAGTQSQKDKLAKLLQTHADATSQRHAVIMNFTGNDDAVIILDREEVRVSAFHKADVESCYRGHRNTLEAKRIQSQMPDFPALDLGPSEWLSTRWPLALHWLRLQTWSMHGAESILANWPFDVVDSLPMFEAILETGRFYAPSLWQRIPKRTLFSRAFLAHLPVDKLEHIDVNQTDQVSDLVALSSHSKETLLGVLLCRERDESFRPLIQHFTALAFQEPDLTEERALATLREAVCVCGSTVKTLIKLGYLQPQQDAWEFYVEGPRAKKRKLKMRKCQHKLA